jgi:tetratricopeptide (TPR) repeat protein
MELTIEQALQQGIAAHKEGKLQDADRLYRTILQSQPLHPDANHNLGVLAVSVNNLDAALPLFKTALEVNPNIEQFWISYIDALIKEKQFNNAKQVLEQAKKQGVAGEKLNVLETQLTPTTKVNEPKSASQKKSLTFSEKRKKLAENKKMKNKKQYLKGISPSDAEINNLLQQYQNGQYGGAEKSALSLTERFPKHQFAWKVLAAVLKQTGRVSESLAASQKSVQLGPQDAEAHSNLGNTLKELGRLDEAEASYTQAIVLKSDYAEAHRHLALMKKFDSQDKEYSKMQVLYLDENISEEQRCHINFGLAKACEDLGDFEQAFQHYKEGNALRKTLLNYDINQDIELFKQLKSSNVRAEQNSLEVDNLANKPMPIFIVGMPRSGTTLVEQIISSHPQVTGAGELPFAPQFGASIATGSSAIDNDALLNFRGKYLTKLQNISNGNLIVTDKVPQNFRYIGLLAAAFPEAKIVHVKRNPAAVCWANYKQYFASKNIGYCYALDDVISYYRLYENLMEFWGNSLSKRIYNLDYELLTVNQENETHQLIDYLGLDWDEKCLSPQDNTRSVATASNMQVRKKVYQGSSQQWKKYEPFLNGALDGLLAP